MEDTQQPVDQPVEEQVTSKVPVTKQKNPKRVAAGKAIAEKTRLAREAQKRLLSIHKSPLLRQNMLILQPRHLLPNLQPRHLLPNLQPPNLHQPKFLQQHNGWALSASSFHWWGSTTNAKSSKTFLLKKTRHNCSERLHLLMLHLKVPSVKWIRHSLHIYIPCQNLTLSKLL